MATPAAVLSLLVQTKGAQVAAAQINAVNEAGVVAGRSMGRLESSTKRTSKVLGSLGSVAKTSALLVGGVGLAGSLKLMNEEYRESQKTGAQTNAVIKSTGGAAKVSAKHVGDLANAISLKSGIDDEAIQSGENLLLTFTRIRNETGKGNKIFDQATKVVTDMSVALDQGVKQSAIQVGKALNDPIKGITALRRVGVSFTAQQEDQIKKMVQSGDLLGAQRRILKELTTEFGGSAAAQATAGDKLRASLNNLAEAAGKVVVPQLDKVTGALADMLNDFMAGRGPLHDFFTEIKNDATALYEVAQPTFKFLADFFNNLPGPVKIATVAVAGFFAVMAVTNPVIAVLAAVAAAAIAIKRNWGTIGPVFNQVKDALVTAFNTMVSTFNTIKTSVVNFVTGVTSAIATEIGKWRVLFAVFDAIKAIVGPGIVAIVAIIKSQIQLVAPIFKAAFGVLAAIVTGAWEAVKAVVKGGLQAIHGIIEVFGGVLKGDFHQIWEGVKDIFRGIGTALSGILRAQLGTVKDAGKALAQGILGAFTAAFNLAHEVAQAVRTATANAVGYGLGLGKALADGIKKGLKSVVSVSILDLITGSGDGLGKARKTGEGIGRKLGPRGAGGGSTNLNGASSALAPFARIGAKFGLSVSSGLRPGAITSSGNVSYHASGQAIDEAGSPSNMLAFFRYMKANFGGRLAELIYTPGGVGIKDGKPFRYTGQVAADHFDHVHVAYASGIAQKMGDGPGRSGPRMGDGLGGNVKKVWQFLIGKGLTPLQAAGIIGGLRGESGTGLSPTALNPDSKAFGIGQWLGKRKTALMKLKNPRSLGTQLGFLWRELQGPEAGALSAVRGSKSIADAVKAWVQKFERPGKGEETLSLRTAFAKKAFGALKGVGGVGGRGGGKAQDQVGNYEMIQALVAAASALAEQTPGTADDILAATQLRGATTFRIGQVKKALKKPNLTPSTRLRLTQELGTLRGTHAEQQAKIQDLRGKPVADALQRRSDLIDAQSQIAQTTADLSDDLGPLGDKVKLLQSIYDAQAKKFGASSVQAQMALANLTGATKDLTTAQAAALDQQRFGGARYQLSNITAAALTMAKVNTPGDISDDLGVLQQQLQIATDAYNEAVRVYDTDAINEFGGQILGLRDSIDQLQQSTEQNTQALLDLERQRREDIQKLYNVSQSQYGVLVQAISEAANVGIGGRVGLGYMSPSFAGGGVRY